MKLNWFSPLPPASTDIAHYTTRVLAALGTQSEVRLWTDQDRWDTSLHQHAVEVRRYKLRRMRWAELNRGDMSVYHIGNNSLFHGSVWQVSQRHPGIVVLHDLRLHHFFAGLYLNRWRDLEAYLAQMEFYYGERGRTDAAAWVGNQGLSIDEMAERYPLTLLALENALGVLVHTEEAFRQLKSMNLWPVAYAPLPFAAARHGERGRALASRTVGPPYRLVVFGYISNNRRLDTLLKALADLPERDRFRLDVYGQLMDEKAVRGQVSSLGLKGLVRLHGFVPETELDAALRSAHLAVNLRYPTMGEASGSQLRIWSHALPSLVTEVGWYAALPSDTVAFVRPAHEVEDIQAHLRALLSDPAPFALMGEKGYRVLEEQHAPEAYARSLISLVADAEEYRKHSASHRLAQRAVKEVNAWTGGAAAREALRVAVRKDALIYGKTKEDIFLPRLRDSSVFKLAMKSATLRRWARALTD